MEYDGSAFRGWAKQDGGVDTVQARLEEALRIALRTDRPVELTVAGRTDAGVHALGQVASFSFDGEMPPAIVRSLNGLTPRGIAVRAVTPVSGFDARKDAVSRTYCYRVLTRRPDSPFAVNRAWWVSRPIDRDALDSCAGALIGRHDFTAFTPTETYHKRFERIIHSAAWTDESGLVDPATGFSAGGDTIQFWVTGDSFMQNMVRILVGTMLEVADGSRSLDNFVQLLEGAERPDAGVTAPPQGLYFVRVDYPDPPPLPVAR
ncbi:MAG TPA: tRNA pseudouridine(38-40) synthase TruA [Solirubrobacterales bacterium]|nr:tRNA pseudouridine(38-40) synthase TruA [Solirubrobacterales bacterium]HMX70969.1 tRNA pseudouridine(38-40) synthase TruA [Solirubrobacterales bacterium]HNA23302.1 tRNA pseudouridine(38-40) synthase TruA [Solirubrobacterales bacterium]HNA43541.1 tRNA pseudouridine(38-40) synthase TruA [Solirubrobacterales bacterium]HNI39112.1 tRNA pseudouridine(38-40) synthase TruA [Solirubrobacterales bacterium]